MYVWLVHVIQLLLTAYWYVLLATAVASWVPEFSRTTIGQLLYRLSEPYLRIFRRFIRPMAFGGMMLDLSFIVAIAVYFLLQQVILSVLYSVLRGISG